MENFAETVTASDLLNTENFEPKINEFNKKILEYTPLNPKYDLNTPWVQEQYSSENMEYLVSRTFYNIQTNAPAYTETFLNDALINSGFVSKITEGNSNNAIGYRYYRDKYEFYSDNYFTIVKNEKFAQNQQSPEYLIVDNCGGEIEGEKCNELMFDLLHNQFKDKFGYEITGNKIISDAIVTTLQQQYKNHPSITLCNVNLGRQPDESPIFNLDDIVRYLPTNKISLIPINTEEHATVLVYNPDGKENNKFHLFDSSGALSNRKEKMEKVFKEENIGKININSLNMDNIQANGCCTIWCDCFIKPILETCKNLNYTARFFEKNIKPMFDNKSIKIILCQQIDEILNNDYENSPFIKRYNNKIEAQNEQDYFTFDINYGSLKRADYYGIYKNCCDSKFCKISGLTYSTVESNVKNTLFQCRCINNKKFLNNNKNNTLFNQLENAGFIQEELLKLYTTLKKVNLNLFCLKNTDIISKLENEKIELENTQLTIQKLENEMKRLKASDLQDVRNQRMDKIVKITNAKLENENKLLHINRYLNCHANKTDIENIFENFKERYIFLQNEITPQNIENKFDMIKENINILNQNIINNINLQELNNTISNLEILYPNILCGQYNNLLECQTKSQSQNISTSGTQQQTIGKSDLKNLQQIIKTKLPGVQNMQQVNNEIPQILINNQHLAQYNNKSNRKHKSFIC